MYSNLKAPSQARHSFKSFILSLLMRKYCSNCLKVEKACFCHKVCKFDNLTKVIILQHPNEAKHALNTAKIAQLSFTNSKLFIGEDFTNHSELNEILKKDECYLLFPTESSQSIEEFKKPRNMTLIIIDGSWKKAKKIFYLSKNLQSLFALKFKTIHEGRYQIRKEPKKGYISTLEAITFALETLDQKNYQDVFIAFDYMIDYQVDKMGLDIYQKNYLEKK